MNDDIRKCDRCDMFGKGGPLRGRDCRPYEELCDDCARFLAGGSRTGLACAGCLVELTPDRAHVNDDVIRCRDCQDEYLRAGAPPMKTTRAFQELSPRITSGKHNCFGCGVWAECRNGQCGECAQRTTLALAGDDSVRMGVGCKVDCSRCDNLKAHYESEIDRLNLRLEHVTPAESLYSERDNAMNVMAAMSQRFSAKWAEANRLSDAAGALRTECNELLVENARLRRKIEKLEKKR